MVRPKKTVLFSYLQLSNVGCEIIMKGAMAFLRSAYPNHDLHFLIPSYPQHVARDIAIFANDGAVEIIPMLGWKRFVRALLRKTGRFDRFWTPRFASKHFKRADLFLSVGGDIYTIFDGRLPDDWMGYETFATRNSIPSIMFGANMEKFELLPVPDRKLLIEHLNRFKLIAVRDRATARYLESQNATAPIAVYPDPIFSLRPACTVKLGRIRTIGLNLSPLALQKYRPELLADYIALTTTLVEHGYTVRLIPHVYSSDGDENLDDRAVLRKLYENIPVQAREAVTLCSDTMTLDAVSAALSQIDLLIAARMHCCLNALTLGKAVLFLEYSVKAKSITDWLRSETPYAQVSERFRSVPADQASPREVFAFIEAVEAFAEKNPDSIDVDLQPLLSASPIWSIVRSVKL